MRNFKISEIFSLGVLRTQKLLIYFLIRKIPQCKQIHLLSPEINKKWQASERRLYIVTLKVSLKIILPIKHDDVNYWYITNITQFYNKQYSFLQSSIIFFFHQIQLSFRLWFFWLSFLFAHSPTLSFCDVKEQRPNVPRMCQIRRCQTTEPGNTDFFWGMMLECTVPLRHPDCLGLSLNQQCMLLYTCFMHYPCNNDSFCFHFPVP